MPTRAAAAAIMILVALHHDFWWWDDPTLIWSFLPIGLAYHLAYSVACAVVWAGLLRGAALEDLAGTAGEGPPDHG